MTTQIQCTSAELPNLMPLLATLTDFTLNLIPAAITTAAQAAQAVVQPAVPAPVVSAVAPTPVAPVASVAPAEDVSTMGTAEVMELFDYASPQSVHDLMERAEIPRTAWFSNLRSELNEAEWTALKRRTFDAAGWVCEVCTCKGPKWPVECHERFDYNEETGVQTLTGTIALCPSCHESTHMGFARTRGREAEAMAHLMAVNDWSDPEARQHVQEAMRTYGRRSARDWQLDARWLIGRLDLSEETREKVMAHAEGLAPRIVTEEQQGIRDAHAYEGQDNGLFDDFIHQPN
ncbi:hypothetical protein [Burkholderia gladioli]|uniref:hypothetical protein n=1 Tax=Burkholderia gladioli TaxID=28095 RepID=UPI00164140E9|nr:hypothetical protein [Burkholderia gladioli]